MNDRVVNHLTLTHIGCGSIALTPLLSHQTAETSKSPVVSPVRTLVECSSSSASVASSNVLRLIATAFVRGTIAGSSYVS